MNAISFFKESEGIWVSENLQSVFLDIYVAQGDASLPAPTHRDLQDISPGVDMRGMVFTDANNFLEQFASLLQNQPAGADGPLLNDSSANYFFVHGAEDKLYSVLVRWEPAQKLWRCGAYLQEELRMPNVRIFYPTNSQ